MSGIEFLVDERGKKKAVVIDLKKHGRLWEDVYDAWICEMRAKGPFESHAVVKRRLKAKQAHA